jgi:hypothetical protein
LRSDETNVVGKEKEDGGENGHSKVANVVADVLEQVRLQCVSIACRFLYDGGSASMHDCVTRDVVSDIDSLCQGALGEQVVYR